jgi:hypothetical protein
MGPVNQRVFCGLRLSINQQLLMEFLARPQAGAHDLDVAARVAGITQRQTGEAPHLFGQILEARRFAHVEQEYIAAVDKQRCLQHQLSGLGDGHEIANDLQVGEVIGPPSAICLRNIGTTEPEEPSRLPKRTDATKGLVP